MAFLDLSELAPLSVAILAIASRFAACPLTRSFWSPKKRSCTSQNPLSPFSARTSIAASAAGPAAGWNGSGSFFQTSRILSPYFSRRPLRVRAPEHGAAAHGHLEHRRRVFLLALVLGLRRGRVLLVLLRHLDVDARLGG